jgi:hypothetical protein
MLTLSANLNEHGDAARLKLARERAAEASERIYHGVFSASWAELLVTPSRTPTSTAQKTNQEFEVAGSLTEATFSANLRSSAFEFLGSTIEALEAPLLAPTSPAAQRLVEAARYVDGKLAEDERRQKESVSAATPTLATAA